MTDELRENIKTELKRAYRYFGEFDELLMEENANNEVEALRCRFSGIYPEIINADGEEIIGYSINVLVTDFDYDKIGIVIRNNRRYKRHHIFAIELVVTLDNNMVYVLHRYHSLSAMNENDDEFLFENETYEKVTLEDINPREYCNF